MKKNIYKCASFFAGVGGIDLGFEKTKKFKVIYANEFDKHAIETYGKNFSIKVDNRDIRDVSPDDIPDFDIMLAGFPCQSFSIAGNRLGFDDDKGRGNLFFELIRIIKIKKPKVVFLENVKNLLTHDKGNTYKVIFKLLTDNGYYVKKAVLNSKDYGSVPQNRERIYIVAFLNEEHHQKFSFPESINNKIKFSDFINFDTEVESKYYYNASNCYFYDDIKDIVKKNIFYQWRRIYLRENKSGVCPTLTANMGTGGHNVPIILSDFGIRKLTPRECFNLQGFPKNYVLPSITTSQLYKQAGNSVVVTVITRIANNIFDAMI